MGNVGALVHRLDLFHSSMPLAWMGISSRTDLDNQQRGLSEQLNSLVKARLIRGRSEPMRLAARKKLHMCEGKREVYEKVVDGQIGLDFESISKEIRNMRAKEERLTKAIEDIAATEPAHRCNMRSLSDRTTGALLVVSQLRHYPGGSWMGSAEPPDSQDGGLSMAGHLLATRHERLDEQTKEEEGQLASKEKLASQHCVCVGAIRGLELLRSFCEDPPGEAMKAAKERGESLKKDISVCEKLVERYEAQRAELEQADQDFEQAFGALSLVENAQRRLREEQMAMLDAVRLQGYSCAMHTQPERQAMLAHRRWLRELAATEQAFGELKQRKLGVEDYEEKEIVVNLSAATNGVTRQFEAMLADEVLLNAIATDLAIWGGFFAHNEDELRVERLAQAKRGPTLTAGLATFIVVVLVTPTTRRLLDMLRRSDAEELLGAHMHRTAAFLREPAPLLSFSFSKHERQSVQAPNSAQLMRAARGNARTLGEKLDKRVVYTSDSREVVSSSFKQHGFGTSSWEWCHGAIGTLVAKGSLRLSSMPQQLQKALVLHPYHASPMHQHQAHHTFGDIDGEERRDLRRRVCERLREHDGRYVYDPHETHHRRDAALQGEISKQRRVKEMRDASRKGGEGADSASPAAAASPTASASKRRASALGKPRAPVTPIKPEKPLVRKLWRSLDDAAQSVLVTNKAAAGSEQAGEGKSEGQQSEGGEVVERRVEPALWAADRAHAMEVVMIGTRSLDINLIAAEAKACRRQMKSAHALETARARLVIHLSTLAEPTLKPNKSVEATVRGHSSGAALASNCWPHCC